MEDDDMTIAIGSPGRYIQGSGELYNLFQIGEHLGKKFFVIISEGRKKELGGIIEESLSHGKCEMDVEIFQGECSMTEINRLTEIAKGKDTEVVVGIGGGKALDTAKAVAHFSNARLIIVPTTAAQDAPCLALSVVYRDDGTLEKYLEYPFSPDVVLVDSEICAKAPVRLFASGMGDGLSTFFESRACYASVTKNGYGYSASQNSLMQAKLCYDVIMRDGKAAYLAVKEGLLTNAVENVIEANVYLSGIGAEGCGDAGAHGIHNALLILPEIRPFYHGEKVAFGILVQMVLENAPLTEIEEILRFYREVGLPSTLAQLNLEEVSSERMMEVAEYALKDSLQNEPFELTPKDVYNAIFAADQLGQYFIKAL